MRGGQQGRGTTTALSRSIGAGSKAAVTMEERRLVPEQSWPSCRRALKSAIVAAGYEGGSAGLACGANTLCPSAHPRIVCRHAFQDHGKRQDSSGASHVR